jgi:polyisoprenoid-binding protein YceI
MVSFIDAHPTYIVGIWVLDPTHSEVTFWVKHLAISKVRGSFERFTATIVTDEEPTKSTDEFGGIVVDGDGQSKAGFSVSTEINRHDFGVNWNAALEAGGLTLGDDVTINLELEFTLQAA